MADHPQPRLRTHDPAHDPDADARVFMAVIVLPDGYAASANQVTAALDEYLGGYSDGGGQKVAVRAIDEDFRWADAMLELNAELDNLGPDA